MVTSISSINICYNSFYFEMQSHFDNSRSVARHSRLSRSLSLPVEPSFVFADVIREGNRADGEDDKIYYFFTEVSVEYEFFGKLLIPRVARVCKVSARHVPSAHTSSVSPQPLCSCSLCSRVLLQPDPFFCPFA